MNIDRLPLKDVAQLSALLGLTAPQLEAIVANKAPHYGRFERTKGDGTKREINPPKPLLKGIQRTLKNFLEKHLVWTRAVHGGLKGRGIISNARQHVNQAWVAGLDIAKFFDSTRTSQVAAALERAGCASTVAGLVAELTTYKNHLPQGSPTSSILGNLVLEPMDSGFMSLCRRHGFIYTRYVDDVTVSGNADLRPFRGGFVGLIASAGFAAQPKKIRFSPNSGPQIVTGLIVNRRLRPAPEFVRDLKADIRYCWDAPAKLAELAASESMDSEEYLRSLWGRVNHVRNVDAKLGRDIRALCVRLPRPVAENPVLVDAVA